MKKTSFLVILSIFLVNVTLKAQTEKGKFLLGGTINPKFYSSKSTHEDRTPNVNSIIEKTSNKELNFASNIKGGFFIIDNLALGLNISETYTKRKSSYFKEYQSFYLAGGPFLRFYPVRKNDFGVFLETGGNIGFRTFSYIYNDLSYSPKSNSINLNAYIGPGINYFINEKVGLEFSIFYEYSKESIDQKSFYLKGSQQIITNYAHQVNAMIGINLFL